MLCEDHAVAAQCSGKKEGDHGEGKKNEQNEADAH